MFSNKNIILIILIIVIIGIGLYIVFALPNNSTQNTSFDQSVADDGILSEVQEGSNVNVAQNGSKNQNQQMQQNNDVIEISFPQSGDTVGNPLIVTGIARGNWFFEGDFPVRLRDANGNEVVAAFARALGEWMTESYVPFVAELNFDPGDMDQGTVVLEKNNPSGLPENAEMREIPVNIDADMQTVQVFFANTRMSQNCGNVVPVARSIEEGENRERAALEELLKGVSNREESLGYMTSINENVEIQRLEINNGVARVDLSETLNENVSGSCRVTAIRAQITETLRQFSTINSVEISINDRTEDILQP